MTRSSIASIGTCWALLAAVVLTSGAAAQEDPIPVVGDVNGDGSITAVDALAVLNHVVGREVPAGFDVALAGDANGDGAITAADALVILTSAVGRDVSAFPVGQAMDASVAVLRGTGVSGSPAQGTRLVPRGRTVAYRFAAEPGFEELRVSLDGAMVPDSGTVTASTAHLLVASASPVVAVPPADAPLVAEVRAMLTAPDPVARFQALLERMATLPPGEAERQLRLASGTGLHGVRDSAAIRRLGQALAGQYFEASRGLAGRLALVAAEGESPVAGSLPSTLLYINGIHSDPFASMATARRIQSLAEERLGWEFGGGDAHRFGRFYNQTWADSPHGSGFQCLAWWQNGGWSVLELAGMQDWYRRCLGEIDILEAAGQWIDVQFQRAGPLDEQARSLAERMRSEIRQGRGVVVVAHSQGNLMAQEALETLPPSALRCVAVVSLAPPTTDGWPDEELAAHGSIFARGQLTQDILLGPLYDLRGKVPAAELIETDTTRRSDAEINILAGLFRGHRAYNPVIAGATLFNNFELHGADASYLAGDATRDRTVALIRSSDSAVEASCADRVVIAPRGATVQVDGTITLTADVFNPLREKLAAPRVEWRSLDPLRANVSAEGHVTGRGAGRVWIRATHGDHTRDSVEVQVGRDSIVGRNPTRLSAGFYHTCALTVAGQAYCWGKNTDGELGNGTTTHALTPTAVAGGVAFAAISTGSYHTCALTAAGQAYCWGSRGYGVLGSGFIGMDALAPTPVHGGIAFAAISAGHLHTCALTAAGQAYCWGSNGDGELGNGSETLATTPRVVAGGIAFAAISAGDHHTCALTAAGQAYCWGRNGYGELGNGSRTNVTTPTAVAGGIAFASIEAGDSHTCALTAAGQAYCWGYNLRGELGIGNESETLATTPTPVAGGIAFAAISAGLQHTCASTAAGQAYCWGSKADAVLGNGATTHAFTPTAVAGHVSFAAISTGKYHTCAVTAAGKAYCWGSNPYGGLGNGSMMHAPTPAPVSGELLFPSD